MSDCNLSLFTIGSSTVYGQGEQTLCLPCQSNRLGFTGASWHFPLCVHGELPVFSWLWHQGRALHSHCTALLAPGRSRSRSILCSIWAAPAEALVAQGWYISYLHLCTFLFKAHCPLQGILNFLWEALPGKLKCQLRRILFKKARKKYLIRWLCQLSHSWNADS